MFITYMLFFTLIVRETSKGREFEDLILHKRVPELVYLQTRKLLRNTHLKRAENRRNNFFDSTVENADDAKLLKNEKS